LQTLMQRAFRPGKEARRVISVGGGPGTDASGLVWAARHCFGAQTTIECHLLDNEPSWRKHCKLLNTLFQPQVTLLRCLTDQVIDQLFGPFVGQRDF
jgi:NAD(P)H-hydrate repair Nnr-like enzyme with NAD(P)H-hydrate epimerase domain